MSAAPVLDLADIQSGALRPRPTPFAATYIILRIDDRAAGRELMRRLSGSLPSAAHPESPTRDTWVSAGLTFAGLRALGVPGRIARYLSDTVRTRDGSARASLGRRRREQSGTLGEAAGNARRARRDHGRIHQRGAASDSRRTCERARSDGLPGIEAIWRQDCHVLKDEKEPFGFKDGISHPAIEGSGIPGTNPHEEPLKAGEFVLGYPDEMGETPMIPQPDQLGRNGSYVVFRKLHQRVAAFRQYLRANAADAADEELVAAKMMGRWRSGTPLALIAGCRRSGDWRRSGAQQ